MDIATVKETIQKMEPGDWGALKDILLELLLVKTEKAPAEPDPNGDQ